MVTLQDIEFEIARQDFFEWLKYVHILEPFPGKGEIPLEPWPHILHIAQVLQENQLIVWLKSRQLGCSWLVAAFTLWKAMYNEGVHVIESAQSEPKAFELIVKQKYIYSALPDGLKVPPKSLENKSELDFPSNHSWIKAYASTRDAARSMTGTIVWFDEADFHEYFDSAYHAALPTVGDVGGQIILTSTSNPENAIEGSLFKTIYSSAKPRGFKDVFYGWRARPDRDDEWFESERRKADDPFIFEKDYAETAEQALAPPDTVVFFQRPILDEMKKDNKNPLEVIENANIYQPYSIGKKYVAGTDTAHGVGGDDSVTVIVDIATGLVVADVKSAFIPPEVLADESVTLLKLYRNPLWAIEDNEWGGQVIRKAIDLKYNNLYHYKKDVPGWHTGHNNRFFMWGELKEAIHSRGLTIPSESGLSQFYTVIRNPKKNGRVEAQSGKHDDYPMALAIAWQLRKESGAYHGSSAIVDISSW